MNSELIGQSIFFITLSLNILLLGEFLYSIIKNDGTHDIWETFVQLLHGQIRIVFVYVGMNIFAHIANEIKMYIPTTSYFSIYNFIICVLLVDFAYYVLHWVHHRFRFWWMFHKVHHTGKKFNLSTTFRVSWVNALYSITFFAMTPLLLGFDVSTILLSVGILNIFNYVSHSAYIKVPHIFSYVFVSPEIHKIHHDERPIYQNSNFGAIFTIWDRLVGTYRESMDTRNFRCGTGERRQNNLIMMEVEPVIEYISR